MVKLTFISLQSLAGALREKARTFLVLISVLFGLSTAAAEEPARIPRIGILIPESLRPQSQAIKGLREGLKEIGYTEKKNILLEIRDAKGDRGALKGEASELVRQKVSLIFTTGTRATQAAKGATGEIPILFCHPADPVALGFVKSMEQPGGNMTGVAALASQRTEKRLEILKEIIPKARRVMIFYDFHNSYSRENFLFAQKAAAKFSLEVDEHPIKSAEELKKSVSGIQRRDGDVLFHVPDDLVEGQADFIFETARQKGLPSISNEEIWAIKGALASYGPNYYQMGRQAARLADKILKGSKPKDLPIQRAGKFDLFINFRTAKAIGLSIPPEVLKKADKVIR
jgi:putative ABC transport system substrate-binding protein